MRICPRGVAFCRVWGYNSKREISYLLCRRLKRRAGGTAKALGQVYCITSCRIVKREGSLMPVNVLANYHTHTVRCHHALGTEEEYIETALRSGYKILGFSDHTPWRYAQKGFVSRIRMLPEEIDGYVETLAALREKYAGRLRLHIGLEAEYFPAYMPWLLEEKERLGIEYLVFGCHYDTTDESGIYFGRPRTAADVRRYAEQVAAGLETGAYIYLAHPDLFLNRWCTFDADAERACREICAAAAQLDIPLEYNLAGLCSHGRADGTLGYTNDLFWQIAAEYPIKAIMGCDAHQPDELDVVQTLLQKREYLGSLGIEVMDTLPGLDDRNT